MDVCLSVKAWFIDGGADFAYRGERLAHLERRQCYALHFCLEDLVGPWFFVKSCDW